MTNALAFGGEPLENILVHYNNFLLERPTGEVSSIAVTALQVNRETCCIRALNYGGPPPLYVDWQGWVQTLGGRASSPLGWFQDAVPITTGIAIPPGPIWMWTDGLEQIAEELGMSAPAVAYALLESGSAVDAEWLAAAGDDILLACIWPGKSAESAREACVHPLIADEYGAEMLAEVDSLQERWSRSLRLALPGLADRVCYDLLLCSREAVINALKYGCADSEHVKFQVVYDAPKEALCVRVSDCGSGYDFDFDGHAEDDLREPVLGHRGLLLMHRLSSRVVTSRNGAEVMMEFETRTPRCSEFENTR